jgi:isochorismate synthase
MAYSDSLQAIALVRYPNSGILAFSSESAAISIEDLSKQKTGFVYAPFRVEEGLHFLNPEKDMHRVFNFIDACEKDLKSADALATTLQQYREAARSMLQQLQQQQLQKVILSRIIETPHSTTAKAKYFFDLLCAEYPKACVHLFVHRDKGIWLGATPETLIQWENNQLSTVAIAGTARYTNEDLSVAVWGEKEIEEHELVSEFISDVLWNQPGIEWLEGNCVETMQAGAVIHLISRFKAYTNQSFEWPELVKKLHPTPAVCGLPLKEALLSIEQNEPHERSFYTGFFGTCSPNSVKLFVNLRCLRWFSDKVHIYVGGGLTALSEVESEWDETTHKSLTLLNVLEKL